MTRRSDKSEGREEAVIGNAESGGRTRLGARGQREGLPPRDDARDWRLAADGAQRDAL